MLRYANELHTYSHALYQKPITMRPGISINLVANII